VSGKTDGQAFYDAYVAGHLYACPPWDDLADDLQKAVEAGAAAVSAAARDRTAELLAELNETRAAFAELAAHFSRGKQSGWTARVSGTVLHRLCLQAKVPDPDGTELASAKQERHPGDETGLVHEDPDAAGCGDEYTARWPAGPSVGVLHKCVLPAGHDPDMWHQAPVDAGLAEWSGDDPDWLQWQADGGDCRTAGGRS
jgi:hypothetical protein